MEKRGFNVQEAQQYLGVKRKFFETNLYPFLSGKGTRAGTATVYERKDLDAAWDLYKLTAGNERPAPEKGVAIWDVQKRAASIEQKMAHTRSTQDTNVSVFANAVARARQKQPSI